MKQLYSTVLFILFGIIYSIKSTNVTILVELESFYYPSKTTFYHKWCDHQERHEYCSPYFVICLTKKSLGQCIQKYEFGGSGSQYEHKQTIIFDDELNENITNPLVFTVSNWTDDLALSVDVFNEEFIVTSLLGRSQISLDWLEIPGSNQTEKWKEVTFTERYSVMDETAETYNPWTNEYKANEANHLKNL
ncbi:hypothetical protein Smp_123920 [Schistosoma mansoni]|uniref:hypothetical protein n=1 Tax=Schistosoma mansoni TaxID=6183 RepID=UPI0001A63F8C|nr:hypothetical protein Smp_123920 [Schistosoma mansoni]|eukprot:XP_018647691.1 hypothetical protein Smp_123920 [Schistosoma mansoni]